MFQAKLENLPRNIKGFKTYIHNIIVPRNNNYQNTQISLYLSSRLKWALIKVNNKNCSFLLKEITYLRYVIKWDEIKNNMKK